MTARLASCIGEHTAAEASTNGSKSMSVAAKVGEWKRWEESRRRGGTVSIYKNDYSNKVRGKNLLTALFGAKMGWRLRL